MQAKIELNEMKDTDIQEDVDDCDADVDEYQNGLATWIQIKNTVLQT